MTRLHVAAHIAQLTPTAHLAQLQAVINDPDNRCARCGQPITDQVAEAVVLRDAELSILRLTHPACAPSDIYDIPGLRVATAQATRDGLNIRSSIACRPEPAPRALVFCELLTGISVIPARADSDDAADPLAAYATALGLTPITGPIDQLTPPPTTTSHLRLAADTLTLHHRHGHDVIHDHDPETLAAWTQTAAADHATALIITARGLGLNQQPPTITEALATRPAYAAQVTVDGLPHRRRHRRLILSRPSRR